MNLETTREIFELIQDEIDVSLAEITSGRVIGETTDATAQNVCRLSGTVLGLSFIFGIGDEVEE